MDKTTKFIDEGEVNAHALLGLCVPIVGPAVCLLSRMFGLNLNPNTNHRQRVMEEATREEDCKTAEEFAAQRPYESGCVISHTTDSKALRGPYTGGLLAELDGPITITRTYRLRS